MKKLRLKILLSKLKAGKKEYFDEFYELTISAVWYVVKKIVPERFFAEDIVQETYVAFLNNLQSVNDDPLPYLCSIAKNRALDSIKKENRIDKSSPFEDLTLSTVDKYEVDFPLLEECKRKLDDEEYFILEQTVIFGYTRVAVAKMLNKPVPTVNRKYNRILKKVAILAKEVYK